VLSLPWSYGSWNYLCTQCLSSLMLRVRISIRARCTTLYDKVCQWLATGRWCSLVPPDSSTNKTGLHDITEILLNMVLITIKQTNKQTTYPVINTSTDYQKSDHLHFSESNTSQVIGGKVIHLRVSPWILRWYHHESLRYSLSTEEWYNLKEH
jgi:hypothetical protein